jgi:hypothetical protein
MIFQDGVRHFPTLLLLLPLLSKCACLPGLNTQHSAEIARSQYNIKLVVVNTPRIARDCKLHDDINHIILTSSSETDRMEESIISFIKNVSTTLCSMKLRVKILILLGLGLVLGAVISTGPIIGKAYAAAGSSVGSGAGAGSAGQSGPNIGGVDHHLFCNMGVITPICK